MQMPCKLWSTPTSELRFPSNMPRWTASREKDAGWWTVVLKVPRVGWPGLPQGRLERTGSGTLCLPGVWAPGTRHENKLALNLNGTCKIAIMAVSLEKPVEHLEIALQSTDAYDLAFLPIKQQQQLWVNLKNSFTDNKHVSLYSWTVNTAIP